MTPIRKLLKAKKGIVGIEAAIVLIAFIVIAAALSYVVINMGFFTTQKTKETMQSGLEESLSALQLDGVVTGKTDATNEIEYVIFPVKLAVGKADLDLKNESVIVSVYLPGETLMNIYNGSVVTSNVTWTQLSSALSLGDDEAKFAMYNSDSDSVLESTEKAFLVIKLGSTHTISDYETVKIEVKTAKGAALTVVRTAPGGMPASSFVDLG
jgi:flagellin FlaB